MPRTHIIETTEPVYNPFLTRNKESYAAGDTVIIERLDGGQQTFTVDFVAREKVNKGWCYLWLSGASFAPVLVDDIPDSVGGGYGQDASTITG